jgi:hypothetical protein
MKNVLTAPDPGLAQKLMRITAQIGFYACVGILIGYYTGAPAYQYADGQSSVLKLVVRHSGVLLGECRLMNEQELKKLPPNMRIPEVCPRGKAPMSVSLLVDDRVFYDGIIKPSGIHSDGVVALYRQFKMPPGQASVRLAIESGEKILQVFEREIRVQASDVLLLEYHDSGFSLSRAAERER